MRLLRAIALGCALIIGIHGAASSRPTADGAQPAGGAQPPAQRAMPADVLRLDNASQYICQPPGTPLCQRASQCTAYCAGGAPVCFQGCCSCAS
jgi:hypothetical protein